MVYGEASYWALYSWAGERQFGVEFSTDIPDWRSKKERLRVSTSGRGELENPMFEVGGDNARLRLGVTSAQHIRAALSQCLMCEAHFPYERADALWCSSTAPFCSKSFAP